MHFCTIFVYVFTVIVYLIACQSPENLLRTSIKIEMAWGCGVEKDKDDLGKAIDC